MYSTSFSRELVLFSAISLPIFIGIVLQGRKSPLWRSAFMVLLVTLAATAPLYVSFRYFIGPAVAFACCLTLASQGLSGRAVRVAVLLCVSPVLAFHSILLSSRIQSQLDADIRFPFPVAELSKAIEQREHELQRCDVALLVDAPPGQVFHMFMTEFFKAALQRANIKAVIVSHRSTKKEGPLRTTWSQSASRQSIEVANPEGLVTEASADVPLPSFGSPVSMTTSEGLQISVDSNWKALRVEWSHSIPQRLCVAEFTCEPAVSLEVKPVT
jgi:hypothetical protein